VALPVLPGLAHVKNAGGRAWGSRIRFHSAFGATVGTSSGGISRPTPKLRFQSARSGRGRFWHSWKARAGHS
jgi:hypothetical protein